MVVSVSYSKVRVLLLSLLFASFCFYLVVCFGYRAWPYNSFLFFCLLAYAKRKGFIFDGRDVRLVIGWVLLVLSLVVPCLFYW